MMRERSEYSESQRRSFGRHTTKERAREVARIEAPDKIDMTDPNGANSELKRKSRSSGDRGFGRYLADREPDGTSET